MSSQQPVFTVELPGTPPPRRGSGLGGYGGTVLSMVLMTVVYFLQRLQLEHLRGLVFMIFVHEMGHVLAALALGIPITAPIFIPFLGASIVMQQNPRDAVTEAIMAYAGPLAGGVGSWICLIVAQSTGQGWLVVVAMLSFWLNLFNMLPVPPMDGGRICAAVSRWFWVPGLLVLVGAVIYFHAWQLMLVGGVILFSAFQRIRQDILFRDQLRAYYRTSLLMRVTVAIFYLGLIAVLLVGTFEAFAELPAGY